MKPTAFYPPKKGHGAFHAPAPVSQTPICGESRELLLEADGLLYPFTATDTALPHPIICRRCIASVKAAERRARLGG